MLFAALGSGDSYRETRKKIVERFKELYEAAGRPSGATLYSLVDSGGYFMGYAMTEEAAKRFPELLEEFTPWHKTDRPPGHSGWEAGDGGPRR